MIRLMDLVSDEQGRANHNVIVVNVKELANLAHVCTTSEIFLSAYESASLIYTPAYPKVDGGSAGLLCMVNVGRDTWLQVQTKRGHKPIGATDAVQVSNKFSIYKEHISRRGPVVTSVNTQCHFAF